MIFHYRIFIVILDKTGPKRGPKITLFVMRCGKTTKLRPNRCLCRCKDVSVDPKTRKTMPLSGFWMPFWTRLAPKGVPKSDFLASNLEKIRKRHPKNDARKNIKCRLIFDAKMGGPDG